MPENIINIFLLLAAAQGFFLNILILHRHGRLFANRIRGLMILLYSIVLLDLMLWEVGFYLQHPYLQPIPAGLGFFIGPLHFLYAHYLLKVQYPSLTLAKKSLYYPG